MFICAYEIGQTDTIGKTQLQVQEWKFSSNICLSLWKLLCQMQTNFLILLSEIPVYGILTHADKQRLNESQYIDRQTRFKNYLGLIDTRFKWITNYCTAAAPTGSYISTTLPRLDIPVLELMTQVSLQWMFHAFFST